MLLAFYEEREYGSSILLTTYNFHMTLSYKKLTKHPVIFRRLLGMDIKNFDTVATKVSKTWVRLVIRRYKRPGRHYKLTITKMLLMLLLYYRSYATQMQIGFMFGLDESRVCRIIKKLEPIVAKIVAIKKDRTLSYKLS